MLAIYAQHFDREIQLAKCHAINYLHLQLVKLG
jgi:hypothetical protein